MISIISTSGHTAYGVKKFVLDTDEDISDLPVDCAMGSTAFAIGTASTYMINSAGQWIKINGLPQ